MSELFLGVDGGQSSTTAIISDDSGSVLGRGTGGPCNHITGPEARDKFRNAVGDCLRQACAEAGISFESLQFSAACLGFSGGSEDKEVYARELIRSHRWKITHDAEIALAGATAGQPGIMVIAGTGSMAFGRNLAGRTARAGGWGYLFGDEGGALYIVKQALRACLRHEEGWGEPTALTKVFLSAGAASTVNQLLHDFYALSRSEIAIYARLVDKTAQANDNAARLVLEDAGKQLAIYVCGAYQNLFLPADTFQVSYVGGAFQSKYLLQAYVSEVERNLGVTVNAPLMSPAAGAVLEALRLHPGTRPLTRLAEQLSTSQIK